MTLLSTHFSFRTFIKISFTTPMGSQIGFTDITFPLDAPVLHSISSEIRKARLVAILGPSGCGKTTLLKILSGRFTHKYNGSIFYNEMKASKISMQHNTAYVHQDDILLKYLTVKETIEFYQRMINTECQDMIGLENVLSQKIGTPQSGISAGERKRLSILISLLEEKEVIFLDEPTSGLDTLNALKLVNILKEIDGTKICVIHQPSSEMFFKFDDVIIMFSGQIVYEGESKMIFQWFADLELVCPKYTNPADFIFTHVFPRLVERHGINSVGYPKFKSTENSFNSERQSKSNVQPEFDQKSDVKKIVKKKNSFLQEILILFGREWKVALRDKSRLYGRWFQSLLISAVIALVFYKTYQKEDAIKCKNKLGLFYFLTMNAFFTSTMSSLPELYQSQNLLEREYQSRYYRYHSFFFAKRLFDIIICNMHPIIMIPLISLFTGYNNGILRLLIMLLTCVVTTIIGYSTAVNVSSVCSTLLVANAVLPSLLLPLTLLNGFLLENASMVTILRLLQYVSPTRYTLRILIRNEFELNAKEAAGNDAITEILTSDVGIRSMFGIMVMMFLFNFAVGFLFLKRKIINKT